MKIYILLCQVCFISYLFFLTGCVSITTWRTTGVETFHITEIEIMEMPDGRIRLSQQGVSEKNYIPYLSFCSISAPEEKIYIYSYNDKEKKLFYSFQLKPNKLLPMDTKIDNGLLILKNRKFDFLMNRKIELNPQDISLLKNQPFFMNDFSANGMHLFIPYRFEQNPDGDSRLFCYSPLEPSRILPDPCCNFYQKEMEGVGINLWRAALMPIPVIMDIATSPVQILMLFFLKR